MSGLLITALLQLLLTTVAAFGLWKLWKLYAAETGGDRALTLIVAVGFLGRALVGQVLFWISWLRLPFLRSLQIEAGYWFFAQDGPDYLAKAWELLEGKVSALTLETQYSSHTFVEVVALLMAACGSAASIGLLLNGAAYLGMCLLILRIGGPGRSAPLVALIAVSYAPGLVLWSLQPLKDTFFVFVVVAFVAALASWQERWRKGTPSTLGAAAALVIVMYALAGLRWYFAAILGGLAAVFFLMVALASRQRPRALVAGVTVFLLLAAAVRVGGAGDMVPFIEHVRTRLGAPRLSIASSYVAEVRRGFESTPGATTIAAGRAVESKPADAPVTELAAPPAKEPAAASAKEPAAAPATELAPAPATEPAPAPATEPAPAPMAAIAAPPVTEPPASPATEPPAPPATESAAPPVTELAAPPVTETAALPSTESAAPPVTELAAPPVTEPAAPPLTARVTPPVTAPASAPVSEPAVPPMTAPVVAAAPPQAAPSQDEAAVSAPPAAVPQSTRVRLITGTAATFLPRFVAQAFGLIDVRGGRGLWLFVELDTLAFDAVVLFAIFYTVSMLVRGRARITPLFILLILGFAATAVPMAYSVSNFGTLFRLREMLYVMAALLPLTLRAAPVLPDPGAEDAS
jgi:hypothetical protein